MLKADIANLAWSLSKLRELEKLSSDRAKLASGPVIDEEFRTLTVGVLKSVRHHFSHYAMPVTLDRLAAFERNLAIPVCSFALVQLDCDEVEKCAESELRRIYFGQVSSEKSNEIEKADQIWAKVIAAFPSCKKDALMASKCYALECNDGSIYHSMMILERGFTALAKKLGIKLDANAWGPNLGKIEAEIEKRRKIAKKSSNPKDFLTFLSESAKEFGYFKDAWRNHTAHGRAQYDENDARKVLIHVRDFMEHISKRLKEARK